MSQETAQHAFKREVKSTLSVGIPLISSQLVYASSGFIGTAMVARLGKDALAASVLVNMIWFTTSVFFFGILNAVSVLVAHQYGAKNYKGISEIMGQAFLLGLAIIAIIMVSFLLIPAVFSLSDQPPNVLRLARIYLHSWLWAMPGLVTLVIYEQFLASINLTKIVLRISLLVVPIEIPLIYTFVFGKVGLPAFGIAGVGYGFSATYTMTSLVMTFLFLKRKHYQPFGLFAHLGTIDMARLRELIAIGTPMGFMHVIEVSTFMVATFWISQFGTTMLAAHQIILQYLGFVITLVFAMSQAVTVRVGHVIGEGNLHAVKLASYVGMFINFGIMLVIAMLYWTIPKFFLSIDMDVHHLQNLELVNDATTLLKISGVLLLFDNFRIVGFGALRGLKETRFPMYASLVSFWLIGLSAAYLFAFHWHEHGNGIWWGLTFGIASGAVIVHVKLYAMLKKINSTQHV